MPPENEKEFLDISKEFSKIQQMYAEDSTQESFNMLLCGEMGSGKSHFLSTCRRPIHIDSFDPGGTKIKPLQDGIKEGWVLVDSRFEKEDPTKPTVAKLWLEEMDRRERMSYFNHIGTYAIDSATSWMDALMNRQLQSAGIAGQAPRFTHDYQPVKMLVRNLIRRIMRFPCDFVLTGHLQADKDEVSGKVLMRFVTIGKGSVIIPTLFDEVYVALAEDGPNGTKYSVLTSPSSHYIARTRIGSMKFDKKEIPDIRKLFTKIGRKMRDLPYEHMAEK